MTLFNYNNIYENLLTDSQKWQKVLIKIKNIDIIKKIFYQAKELIFIDIIEKYTKKKKINYEEENEIFNLMIIMMPESYWIRHNIILPIYEEFITLRFGKINNSYIVSGYLSGVNLAKKILQYLPPIFLFDIIEQYNYIKYNINLNNIKYNPNFIRLDYYMLFMKKELLSSFSYNIAVDLLLNCKYLKTSKMHGFIDTIYKSMQFYKKISTIQYQ